MSAPPAAAIESAWVSERSAFGAATLGDGDFATLAEGGVVLHRVDTPTGSFATGAVWVAAPIESAWVTIQDAQHRPLSNAATSEWLASTPTTRLTYQHLDLPWPVSDRQWVASYAADSALYGATGGRVWRRSWTLGDPAAAPHPDPKAVWVDQNTGSWTMMTVGDGTLCVMAVQSVIGGSIPTSISQSWAGIGLRRVLTTVAELATTTSAHYSGDHEAYYRPDGTPIPRS